MESKVSPEDDLNQNLSLKSAFNSAQIPNTLIYCVLLNLVLDFFFIIILCSVANFSELWA